MKYLYIILSICIAMIAGILIGRSTHKDTIQQVIIKDTIAIERERIKTNTRIDTIHIFDTAVIVVRDTICDTIVVSIPIESKVYSDSISNDSANISWQVNYSGYRAQIDNMQLNYTLRPQSTIVPQKKGFGQFVGVGVGAGYGLVIGTKTLEPTIGIHVVYGFGYHF